MANEGSHIELKVQVGDKLKTALVKNISVTIETEGEPLELSETPDVEKTFLTSETTLDFLDEDSDSDSEEDYSQDSPLACCSNKAVRVKEDIRYILKSNSQLTESSGHIKVSKIFWADVARVIGLPALTKRAVVNHLIGELQSGRWSEKPPCIRPDCFCVRCILAPQIRGPLQRRLRGHLAREVYRLQQREKSIQELIN